MPPRRPEPPTAPRDLTRGPIATTLLLFALPILGGNVLQSLNGSINAVWIGHLLGPDALAAIANANNILFLLLGAVFGVGMAATILVAQAIGRADLPGARRVIGTSATVFLGASVLVALAGLPLSGRVLAWMDTPAEALPHAEAYLQIIFLAVPFLYALAFLSAILRGAGDSRTPFLFLLLVVALDIVLVPLLLLGVGPLPAMGMAGAAAANLIANALGVIAMLAWLRHRDHRLWIHRSERALYRPDWTIVRALLAKGLPMGLQMVMLSAAMIAMISMVNRHGIVTAAGYGAALQLWTYVQMPAMAIGAACSTMAAQNVGAGHWGRVSRVAGTGVAFNLLMTGVLFGVVRSTGAVLPPLLILAVTLWGVRVPFATWLQPVLGVDAIWWSFPASAICAMALAIGYYRWGGWRSARMLPDEEPVAIPSEVPAQPPSPIAGLCRAEDASGRRHPAPAVRVA